MRSELDGQAHDLEGLLEGCLGLVDAEDDRQVREHLPSGLTPRTQGWHESHDPISQLRLGGLS
jgi:hypothetical protein